MATFVQKCDCVHEFQDKEYGKNKRIHNEKANEKEGKCTVCGKINHKPALKTALEIRP